MLEGWKIIIMKPKLFYILLTISFLLLAFSQYNLYCMNDYWDEQVERNKQLWSIIEDLNKAIDKQSSVIDLQDKAMQDQDKILKECTIQLKSDLEVFKRVTQCTGGGGDAVDAALKQAPFTSVEDKNEAIKSSDESVPKVEWKGYDK